MDAFLKKATQTSKQTFQNTGLADLTVPLLSEDPLVKEFYAQLTPAEQIAHKIATEKLGTSYDVTRTHGYLRWLKTRPVGTH